jgi:arginyl-tRNA synthetase
MRWMTIFETCPLASRSTLAGAARNSRLALVEASMWTLKNALNCLGLEGPEEM